MPDADPAATDGAADCDAVPADGLDEVAGVVLEDVPECPSNGVLTGGVWTGAVGVDGVLTEGVVTEGVVRLGVLTGGVVIGPTVTEGTVAVGAVTDGTVADGSDTVGVVTVGTPSATASPTEVAETSSIAPVRTTAISVRLIDPAEWSPHDLSTNERGDIAHRVGERKLDRRAYTNGAPDQAVARWRSDRHRHRVPVEYHGPIAAAALGRIQGAIDALEHGLDLEWHGGGRYSRAYPDMRQAWTVGRRQ